MDIVFSIVISAYNVENCIKDSLECLLNQKTDGFEVIVIDDSSKDHTGEILENYKTVFREKAIPYKVFHKEINEGLSKARNTGLELARGEYILFFDADDIYSNQLIEVLKDELENGRPDIVLFAFTEDYLKKDKIKYSVEHKCERTYLSCDKPEVYAEKLIELENTTMLGYAWNKAYKREFLVRNNIHFNVIKHIEDIQFNLECVRTKASLQIIEEVLYHYKNAGQERLTSRYFADYFALQKTRIHNILITEMLLLGIEKKEELPHYILEIESSSYFRSFQSYIVRELNNGSSKSELIRNIKKEMQTNEFVLMACHLNEQGKAAKLLYVPLARRQIAVVIRNARLVGFCQRWVPNLYARLKQNR